MLAIAASKGVDISGNLEEFLLSAFSDFSAININQKMGILLPDIIIPLLKLYCEAWFLCS